MLITYNDLCSFVEDGVITDVLPEDINGSSIDVHLGPIIYIEDPRGGAVDLIEKEIPQQLKCDLRENRYYMLPGDFVLAQTREQFNLPDNISAEFKLKSSGARAGLDNSLATWCDPYWHGSVLTLELFNNLKYHDLILTDGMPIGQIIFWEGEPVPKERGYGIRGQYNNDAEAQPSRGLR